MKIEKTTVIYKGLTVVDPWKITIGAGSIIGDDNILDGRGYILIGDNVNLSSQVRIWTGEHNVQGKHFEYSGETVRIGNRAWISGNVTIYAGIPARKIGDRNSDIDYEFDGKHDWFF